MYMYTSNSTAERRKKKIKLWWYIVCDQRVMTVELLLYQLGTKVLGVEHLYHSKL